METESGKKLPPFPFIFTTFNVDCCFRKNCSISLESALLFPFTTVQIRICHLPFSKVEETTVEIGGKGLHLQTATICTLVRLPENLQHVLGEPSSATFRTTTTQTALYTASNIANTLLQFKERSFLRFFDIKPITSPIS